MDGIVYKQSQLLMSINGICIDQCYWGRIKGGPKKVPFLHRYASGPMRSL